MITLSGCSAHPGAGTWASTSENRLKLAKLVVHFEGRAEFLTKDANELLRCFWAASDGNTLGLECTAAEDTDTQVPYVLVVDADSAILTSSGSPVANLKRVAE